MHRTNACHLRDSYDRGMTPSEFRSVVRLLPVFVVVAEVGQVTTAAAVLGMPQPTVSRALARLGVLLGTPVVERDGRGITLTAAGRALLPYAQEGVGALERGVDVVTRSSELRSVVPADRP